MCWLCVCGGGVAGVMWRGTLFVVCGGGCAWQERQSLKRAVPILLESIIVNSIFVELGIIL